MLNDYSLLYNNSIFFFSWKNKCTHTHILVGSLSLAHILNAQPDVMDISLSGNDGLDFLILASDGLWDVVSSQEAVNMVQLVISEGFGPESMQEGAKRLTLEAYVRGSMDNIGKRAGQKNKLFFLRSSTRLASCQNFILLHLVKVVLILYVFACQPSALTFSQEFV